MAVVRTTTNLILRGIFNPAPPSSFSLSRFSGAVRVIGGSLRYTERGISFSRIRCAAASDGKKVSSRLSQVQQLLQEAEDRALSADNQPTPKITLDHVTVSFARSGGPGGQNVNKVNTKVDMRFNVNNAYWLSDRIREKITQMEKNRINKDGELVISSTKTRTQKGNIEDALAKLQVHGENGEFVEENDELEIRGGEKGFVDNNGENRSSRITWLAMQGPNLFAIPLAVGWVGWEALLKLCGTGWGMSDVREEWERYLVEIIDAASYVPPPPSEEQKKKIAKMAAIGEQKRLKSKKVLSDKKAFRRSRNSWD
uniref:Prokaryotic-type class I peptide chain release factors domain-containing protein n=1 Tax=Fagus sylvatica TaxID=28930 RepID=A0A2N9HPX3_FAGSY